MRRRALVSLCLIAACNSTTGIAPPRSADRPTRTAVVCVRFESGAYAGIVSKGDLAPDGSDELARCAPLVGTTNDNNPAFGTRTYVVHAFSLQTRRGEVAAIAMGRGTTAATGPRILDSDTLVPGFTFVPFGELPTDIAVLEVKEPSRVYVSSRGGLDVESVPTACFFQGGTCPPIDVRPRVEFPAGAPERLVLSPDENFLYASVPTDGAVYEIALGPSGEFGAVRRIAMPTAEVPAVAAASGEPGYEIWCSNDTTVPRPGVPTVAPPRAPRSVGTTSAPRGLVVAPADPRTGQPARLLVADANRPLIHLLDLGATGAAAPVSIGVGVPTLELAITPPVPEAWDSVEPRARYGYAIDATDGTVLAFDYTHGAPTFGAVLTVEVSGASARDRIRFAEVAQSLEVVTPFYDPSTYAPSDPATGRPLCTLANALGASDPVSPTPARLRGVFLAVALTDATVRIVDVYDRDAPCRGTGALSGMICTGNGPSSDNIVAVRRHRPRVGNVISVPVTLSSSPQFTSSTLTATVGDDGVTSSEQIPNLRQLGRCPTGEVSVLPRPVAGGTQPNPVLCVLGDPWSVVSEGYSAVFEGAIPGLGGAGRLTRENGALVLLDAGARFCSRGTLAASTVAAVRAADPAAPEAAYGEGGDQLAIVSPPTGSPLTDASVANDCSILAQSDSTGKLIPLYFPILRASEGRLELGELIGRPDLAGVTLEKILSCHPELVSYEIRARGAHVVYGQQSGALHRVRAGADGTCEVDTSRDPRLISRAFDGALFDNGLVAFQLDQGGLQPAALTRLFFQLANVPFDLVIDGGRLITALRYCPGDRRLYVVETTGQGLQAVNLENYTVVSAVQ